MQQVVVVVGGGKLPTRAVAAVDHDALIIAADSGLDHARRAGLLPTVVVGDMDSISRAGLNWAHNHGIQTRTHPRDKDDTDTALALDEARSTGHSRLLVIGGSGDRLDHTLGTMLALGDEPNQQFATIDTILGEARIHTVFPGRSAVLDAPAGATFSLLPLHGSCPGVSVEGARWPLDNATLAAGSTRGVSNLVIHQATIAVAAHPLGATPITVVIT